MWMIDPTMLCRKHLLGEHVELHMFIGTINKNKKLNGYRENGLVEVHNIKSRHAELVSEMKSRGMNHNSPLQKFKNLILRKLGFQVCPGPETRIDGEDKQTTRLFSIFAYDWILGDE